MTEIYFLKWQLHIAVMVIVVDVLTPIVHGQIFHYSNCLTSLLMLEIVSNKNGKL